ESFFRDLAHRYHGRVAVRIGFDSDLAQRIYAGSDMFLMPSKFEPCGLGQLVAMRYGTIPVVRRTGGLADTVDESTGFIFDYYDSGALVDAVWRAVNQFADTAMWSSM